MSLLGDASIRVELSNGKTEWQSLPAALALLMANELTSFPALRPHQRHAWHAFLSQLGAQALHVAGQTEATFDPPADESAWERLLRNLAPCDDAWSLVTQPNRPALLQPPLPDGLAALNKALETPDELDMLVTAKNHDLKQAVMARAEPDDWLFALVSLQTMGGFLGAGNYGISRMNGGFANRPAVGIVPPGGAGAHLRRDIGRMLGLRGDTVARNQCAQEGGIGLLWLTPWDGATSISLSALDPYYIEICRRVRLVAANNGHHGLGRLIQGATGDISGRRCDRRSVGAAAARQRRFSQSSDREQPGLRLSPYGGADVPDGGAPITVTGARPIRPARRLVFAGPCPCARPGQNGRLS
jgi:CRISPR system Cascade subunit CasA